MTIEKANRLELHYFLQGNLHMIDAIVRNKCEREILCIAKDIITALDLDVIINVEPPAEGGFKDFWKFIAKNDKQLTLILVALTLILSRIPTSNKELEKKQIENLELDSEEKRLNIEKLKKEMENANSKTTIEDTVNFFDSNYKIIKHKSNLYETLIKYPEVIKISTSISFDNEVQSEPIIIEKSEFHKFILTSNNLPPLTIENAVIEIAAPVVIDGNFKWKGVYEGRTIDFIMGDNVYSNSVKHGEVLFHEGFYINCLLKISRQINEFGTIKNTGFKVVTVLGKVEDGKIIETEQGKKYKKIKAEIDKQSKMDFG